MGRGNSQSRHAIRGRDTWAIQNGKEPWKRERPTRGRRPAAAASTEVDVPGIIFWFVAVVFVIYPLVQWALGR